MDHLGVLAATADEIAQRSENRVSARGCHAVAALVEILGRPTGSSHQSRKEPDTRTIPRP
jgi:hypothetical protein